MILRDPQLDSPIEFNFEKIRTISINLVLRLFGNSRDIDFYKKKISEFWSVFIEQKKIDLITDSITVRDLTQEYFVLYPTNDFKIWEELHKLSSDPYFDNINILQLIYRITKYDIRQQISLLFCLGLMPELQTSVDFMRKFDVSSSFIPSYSSIAVNQLIDDLLVDELPVLTPGRVNQVKDVFNKINNFDTNQLLRYENGDLISGDSSVYKLAGILFNRKHIDLSKLSNSQLVFIQKFTAVLENIGRFVSYYKISDEMQVSFVTLQKHIDDILDKLNTKKFYIRTSEDKIMEVDPEGLLGRILILYEKDPNLLNHPNLKDIHRRFLIPLFESKDAKGIYKSVGVIANEQKLERTEYTYIFTEVLDRIEEVNQYFDKDGNRIDDNEARVKLMPIYQDESFRATLSSSDLSLVNLLMEREGNKFKYSYDDIAKSMQLIGRNPTQAIRSKIFRLMSKIEKNTQRFINEQNQPLIKGHLRLIQTFVNLGEIPERLIQNISENDLNILRDMLKTDKYGRYKSYEHIAEMHLCKPHNIRDVVTRVLSKLQMVMEI